MEYQSLVAEQKIMAEVKVYQYLSRPSPSSPSPRHCCHSLLALLALSIMFHLRLGHRVGRPASRCGTSTATWCRQHRCGSATPSKSSLSPAPPFPVVLPTRLTAHAPLGLGRPSCLRLTGGGCTVCSGWRGTYCPMPRHPTMHSAPSPPQSSKQPPSLNKLGKTIKKYIRVQQFLSCHISC